MHLEGVLWVIFGLAALAGAMIRNLELQRTMTIAKGGQTRVPTDFYTNI